MRRIFWGFCRNRFQMSRLHYLSSRSNFAIEFAEIFLIKKRQDKIPYGYNFFKPLNKSMVIRSVVGESSTLRLVESESRRLPDSPSRRVVFRLRISPQIRSQNQNGSKCSVGPMPNRFQQKTPENPSHCHVL